MSVLLAFPAVGITPFCHLTVAAAESTVTELLKKVLGLGPVLLKNAAVMDSPTAKREFNELDALPLKFKVQFPVAFCVLKIVDCVVRSKFMVPVDATLDTDMPSMALNNLAPMEVSLPVNVCLVVSVLGAKITEYRFELTVDKFELRVAMLVAVTELRLAMLELVEEKSALMVPLASTSMVLPSTRTTPTKLVVAVLRAAPR